MARTGKEEVILQIRCHADAKLAFKVLAVRINQNYENTLKRLLALEEEHPLQKLEKGQTIRLG